MSTEAEVSDGIGAAAPMCAECKTKEAAFWHRSSNNDIICNVCHDNRQEGVVTRTLRSQAVLQPSSVGTVTNLPIKGTEDMSAGVDNATSCLAKVNSINTTRKSNRLKPANKARTVQNTVKPSLTKGRSRKAVLKKNQPLKAPLAVSTIVPSDYIFFEGNYWQIGDVVSVNDEEDGAAYYAQLRGFLQDQYCGKSAVITWLIPKMGEVDQDRQPFPSDFDPKYYVAGPEEDLPRDMFHFEFVCHAPSDYFSHRSAYNSRVMNPPALGCVWTRFGPEIQTISSSFGADGTSPRASSAEQDSQIVRSDTDTKNNREFSRRSSTSREKAQSSKMTNSRFKERLTK